MLGQSVSNPNMSHQVSRLQVSRLHWINLSLSGAAPQAIGQQQWETERRLLKQQFSQLLSGQAEQPAWDAQLGKLH